jgi:hypothetical protein
MRTSLKLSIATLSLAVGISACRDANANSGADQADLKRDLEMAASATISLAAPKVDSSLLKFEGQPKSAPQVSTALKKSPGKSVVQSKAPTVRSEPVVEADVVESEMMESVSDASATESTEPVAVAPRPTPVIPTGGTGDYGNGGGIFGGGTGGGVVIRGGGVDGDNCDLHRRGGRRGVPVYGVPVYIPPSTGGSIPARPGISIGMGGFGGGRRAGATGAMGGASRVTRVSSGIQGVSHPTVGRRGR